MRIDKNSSLFLRSLFMIITAVLLIVPAIYSRPDKNTKPTKSSRPRKLGESLATIRRDPKTGRLITDATTSDSASYVEKADAQSGSEDEISLNSKLFAFELMVQDPANKRYVLDLKQDDFVIYDDDQELPASYFVRSSIERVPTNIVLILDHSGSVTPYWEESKKAAMSFVRQLKPEYESVALVLDDPTLLVDFTNDGSSLEKSLSKVKLIKHTYNFTALFSVLNEMFADRDGRKIVIFQTDGDEALKLVPQQEWPADVTARFPYDQKVYTLKDIVDFAANSGVTVYSIAVGNKLIDLPPDTDMKLLTKEFEDEGHYAEHLTYFRECQRAMKQVADVTGGSISYMAKSSDAESIYNGIKDDLRARYIIGYYPNTSQANRYHKITVKIKNHPDWVVTSRQGYFAASKK
ncbi:MAG TPA: VWA domain-containing protein [Blastocatellia bacterium]|nr:VWA domain-containing protein [Blastocatellia bacterium]